MSSAEMNVAAVPTSYSRARLCQRHVPLDHRRDRTYGDVHPSMDYSAVIIGFVGHVPDTCDIFLEDGGNRWESEVYVNGK